MTATHPLHDRITLVFDFDLTLAPRSIDALLGIIGVERGAWEKDTFEPLAGGWDQIIAHAFGLMQAAKSAGRPLDREIMKQAGQRLHGFEGVLSMPRRLREAATEIAPGVELDFTILSSGFVDVILHTEVAACFDRVWGSSFHYNDEGRVVFIKRTITHPEKALYLQALAKGLKVEGANAPRGTTRPVEEERMYVPVDQMIYVGDGASDLQAFEFVESGGGLAIAVDKDKKFDAEAEMHSGQRPENLAPPDYREGSELMQSLILAVRSHAGRIALRRLSAGE